MKTPALTRILFRRGTGFKTRKKSLIPKSLVKFK